MVEKAEHGGSVARQTVCIIDALENVRASRFGRDVRNDPRDAGVTLWEIPHYFKNESSFISQSKLDAFFGYDVMT